MNWSHLNVEQIKKIHRETLRVTMQTCQQDDKFCAVVCNCYTGGLSFEEHMDALGGDDPSRLEKTLGFNPLPKDLHDQIKRFNCTTKKGNILSFFYNPDNDLLVVDLIGKEEVGGNEIVRMKLNEKRLLQHLEEEEK